MHTKTWNVQILISEEDGVTRARAVLAAGDATARLHGEGTARAHPGEPDVPEIGDEVAVSRALSALGHALLDAALEDVRWVLQKT